MRNPATIGQEVAGPGDPGIFPQPVQQLGQDPLSLLTSGALAQLLQQGGQVTSPVGEAGTNVLGEILGGGSLDARLESIRETMDRLRRTQSNVARGELEDRGLLSMPGIEQGPERTTISRLEERLAPIWAQAARDAFVGSEGNVLQAAEIATGIDQSSLENILNTANSVTGRQQMLSQLAIQSLDQNIGWNKFLAEFGLDRDIVQLKLQQGQLDAMLPLIAAFMTGAQTSIGGFVGE